MTIERWKWRAVTLAVTAFASLGVQADDVRPSPGAVAASGIEARTKEAPVIKAARDAQPSEIRPDSRPVPQIAIPLRRGARAVNAAPPPDTAPVDDDVARCIALKSRTERRDCLLRRPG